MTSPTVEGLEELGIAEVAALQTRDALEDATATLRVAKVAKPVSEARGLANREHA